MNDQNIKIEKNREDLTLTYFFSEELAFRRLLAKVFLFDSAKIKTILTPTLCVTSIDFDNFFSLMKDKASIFLCFQSSLLLFIFMLIFLFIQALKRDPFSDFMNKFALALHSLHRN